MLNLHIPIDEHSVNDINNNLCNMFQIAADKCKMDKVPKSVNNKMRKEITVKCGLTISVKKIENYITEQNLITGNVR